MMIDHKEEEAQFPVHFDTLLESKERSSRLDTFRRRAVLWTLLLSVLCLMRLSQFVVTTPLEKHERRSYPQLAPTQHWDPSSVPIHTEAELAAMNCSHMPWYNYSGKMMWIPGYPGSGSEMLRTLIIAMTGLGGHGLYGKRKCFNHTATCKTHWPLHSRTRYDPSRYTQAFTEKTIILLRNPKNALPSWFNYQWEDHHHVDTHSTQAPERDWNEWRDAQTETQLSKYWEGLVRDWKQQKGYRISFYLPFERLVDIETGPQLVMKLAAELRAMGVRVADTADIPCLWYKIVKGGRSKDKRAPHKYVPSYTTKQRDAMLSSLQNMQQEFADDSELVDILSMYVDDIQNNIRIDDTASS